MSFAKNNWHIACISDRNSLVWNAVPTLVNAPNPPKKVTTSRPPPRTRELPPKKEKIAKQGAWTFWYQIKWDFVDEFYRMYSSLPICMAPKLTEKHINLPPFSAMGVKLATQVLSHTVAAGITTLCALKAIDADAIHTAQFIDKMDSLFNVFYSSSLSDSHPLRRAIKQNSDHFAFIDETAYIMTATYNNRKECIQYAFVKDSFGIHLHGQKILLFEFGA